MPLDDVREWFTEGPVWLVVATVLVVAIIIVVVVLAIREGRVVETPWLKIGGREPDDSGGSSAATGAAEADVSAAVAGGSPPAPGQRLGDQAPRPAPSAVWRRYAVVDHKELFGVEERIAVVAEAVQSSDPPLPVSLFGEGGIGKTAVAYEVAKRCADSGAFTRIVWIPAKGDFLSRSGGSLTRTAVDAATATAQVDDMVKVLGEQLEADLGMARSQWQRKLADHIAGLGEDVRLLVVVDNVESVAEGQDAIAFLQDLGVQHPHRLLVTTRWSLRPRLSNIPQFEMERLEPQDALALVLHLGREAPDLLQADRQALQPILDVTDGNPFLIKLVVRQFLTSGLTLTRVLQDLTSVGREEGLAQQTRNHLCRRSLEVLANRMTISVANALMGAFCGKRRGETVSYDELKDNAGLVEQDRFDEALQTAIELALVTATELNKRYAIHSLLHEYTCQTR